MKAETSGTGLAGKAAIYRIIVSTIILAILLCFGLLIIYPFIPAMVIGLIFAIATWPAFLQVKSRLKNATLAATIMTFGLALLFIVPFLISGNNIAKNYNDLYAGVMSFLASRGNGPPAWLAKLPYVSSYIDQYWSTYVSDSTYVEATVNNNMGPISQWFLAIGASIGSGITDLALGVFFSFFLFRNGIEALAGLNILLNKFVGARSHRLLTVTRKTIVSIIYGLLGTALVQAIIAGIGFWIAGIPGPIILAGLIFILSPVPVGPPLIWVPAAVWLFVQHQIGMAIFMFLWGLLAISTIDNILRPYLISHGSKLPLLLAFLGVLGGILSFGFIGLFIGPTILAVIYVLLLEEISPDDVALAEICEP